MTFCGNIKVGTLRSIYDKALFGGVKKNKVRYNINGTVFIANLTLW